MGFVFGILIQYAVLPLLAVLNSPWYIWLMVIVVVAADFVASMIASFYGGASFAAAFLLVGWATGDSETIMLGAIALIGVIGAMLRKSGY